MFRTPNSQSTETHGDRQREAQLHNDSANHTNGKKKKAKKSKSKEEEKNQEEYKTAFPNRKSRQQPRDLGEKARSKNNATKQPTVTEKKVELNNMKRITMGPTVASFSWLGESYTRTRTKKEKDEPRERKKKYNERQKCRKRIELMCGTASPSFFFIVVVIIGVRTHSR